MLNQMGTMIFYLHRYETSGLNEVMFPPDLAGEEQEEKGEDESQDAQKLQREKMQLLVSAFSNAQQDQYEIFRRSTFPKSGIRKLMQNICGGTVPQNAVIAMAGITKVGE